MSYTFAKLPVTQQTYNEIKSKLERVGYQHAFLKDGCIDMYGIALEREERLKEPTEEHLDCGESTFFPDHTKE